MHPLNVVSNETIERLKNGILDVSRPEVELISVKPKFGALEKIIYQNCNLNVEESVSNPYIFKSKISIIERNVINGLGFDPSCIQKALRLIEEIYSDFELIEKKWNNSPFAFSDVQFCNLRFSDLQHNVWGGFELNSYYKNINIGYNLDEETVIIQYFIDRLDSGECVSKARILIPFIKSDYYSIIVHDKVNFDDIRAIINRAAIAEGKLFIKKHFQDEDIDTNSLSDDDVIRYYDLYKMLKI